MKMNHILILLGFLALGLAVEAGAAEPAIIKVSLAHPEFCAVCLGAATLELDRLAHRIP